MGYRGGPLLCHGAPGAQKNTLQPWLTEQWCIPSPSAEFVARMEDRLELYEEPDAPQRPRICCDECPCPLLGDGCARWPMVAGAPERFDDDYTRHGTGNMFILVALFQGWRHLIVTTRRPKQEFAQSMAELVEVHVPAAAKIRVVLDHLSTHTPGALYDVFPPAAARRI
jgi:hypothetical protein